MLIWEKSFVYVFSRNADMHLGASKTDQKEVKDATKDEDSCGGSRDDTLGGVKSSCFTILS